MSGVQPLSSDPLVEAQQKQFRADILAKEAAQLIPALCAEMISKCLRLSQKNHAAVGSDGLRVMCDGIASLGHTVAALRGFHGLSRGDRPRLDLLEDALEAAFKDLSEANRRGYDELARSVLSEDLPAILQAWASDGPALLAPNVPG
ncbi:MAG TPA: hypothetical protein VL588_12155 [Bdellovibrionota bacterium]|nr:hypothetical protein [Bdellovibrionota bacterium]